MTRNPDGSFDRETMREIGRQGRAQQRERRSVERFEAQNQARDEEELRNARAEDAHLEANFNALLRQASRMDDAQFDRFVKRNRGKVRKAGGRDKLANARAKKRSGCLTSLVVLALVSWALLASVGYGGYQLVALAVLR